MSTITTMPTKPIADKLRTAIAQAERRGITRYAIAQQAGVNRSTITLFMQGDRQLRLDIAERIAAAIGKRIDLTTPPKR